MAVVTPEEVVLLMGEGMKQSEIARRYGVSRQYICQLAQAGGHTPLTPIVAENMPWEVPSELLSNTIYKALRLFGHWQLDNEALAEASLTKIRGFLNKLERFNQVVDYDPSYPAVPGLTNMPGFAYVPRVESDENFVFRVREGVRITPVGNRIWRLPEGGL
nr:hypothetical protein [Corynebacterium lactis]